MNSDDDFLPSILPVPRANRNQTIPQQSGINENAIVACPPPASMQTPGLSTNQLISFSQAVLRGAFAGASFQGPVMINFNLPNHNE